MLASLLAVAAFAAQAGTPADAPSASMQALVQNCDAHKFETVITVTVEGQVKHSKVKLCGTEGQTDAQWIATLRDALDKTAANPEMPPQVKDQIIAAVKGEITRLTMGQSVAPSTSTALNAIPPSTNILPRPRPMIQPQAQSPEYAALPPIPTAPVIAPPRLIGPTVASLPRPKLSFSCFTPGETGDVPCSDVSRDTFVTVAAGEDIPPGTSVRFVRGDSRADVAVAQLRRGKSVQFVLPRDVCAGVGGGRLEIEIVRGTGTAAEQVVGSEGPYNLRC